MVATIWTLITVTTNIVFVFGDKSATDEGEERIVGGKVATGADRPHFMAIFNFKPSSTVKCTASIISKRWLISAAHCMVAKEHFFTSPCLAKAKNIKFRAECKTLNNGDTVVNFPPQKEATPEVYIEVDDMMAVGASSKDKLLVEQIVLHKEAYKGSGQYGEYGGYDFIIIKVSGRDMPSDLAACLPGPSFKPRRPFIGGYGRYRRVPCETTNQGPQVYEYCKVDPTCTKGSRKFKQAKCNVEFNYNGMIHDRCIRDLPTPSKHDPMCEQFRSSLSLTDKRMQSEGINEMVLLDSSMKLITSCYRTSPGRHGWCGTTKNIITGRHQDRRRKDSVISSSRGWGMCGDTCEDQEQTHLTGKARVKHVEIMDQSWCDNRLAAIRHGREKPGQVRGFWVFPQVYCVAYNETYKTVFYQQEGNNYRELVGNSNLFRKMGREEPYYIRATGSCKGDSGGPLYEKVGSRYVVIGTTSRGTGPIGNCGGRGNPTHYVRVQYLVPWLLQYIPREEICIVNTNDD